MRGGEIGEIGDIDELPFGLKTTRGGEIVAEVLFGLKVTRGGEIGEALDVEEGGVIELEPIEPDEFNLNSGGVVAGLEKSAMAY